MKTPIIALAWEEMLVECTFLISSLMTTQGVTQLELTPPDPLPYYMHEDSSGHKRAVEMTHIKIGPDGELRVCSRWVERLPEHITHERSHPLVTQDNLTLAFLLQYLREQ